MSFVRQDTLPKAQCGVNFARRDYSQIDEDSICQPFFKYFEDKSGLSLKNTYVRVDLTRDHPGYHLQPHLDRRGKQVTVQIYLGEDNIGTELYDEHLAHVKTVPFKLNCGYFFFSKAEQGELRWHGVTEKVASLRDSAIINYIMDDEDPILGDMIPDDVDIDALHAAPPGESMPMGYDRRNPAAVSVKSEYNVPLSDKAFDVEDWWHV